MVPAQPLNGDRAIYAMRDGTCAGRTPPPFPAPEGPGRVNFRLAIHGAAPILVTTQRAVPPTGPAGFD